MSKRENFAFLSIVKQQTKVSYEIIREKSPFLFSFVCDMLIDPSNSIYSVSMRYSRKQTRLFVHNECQFLTQLNFSPTDMTYLVIIPCGSYYSKSKATIFSRIVK